MSQVIYARVPDELKDAADSFADEHSMTLTSAVVELLERGLTATTDEFSIEDLQRQLHDEMAERAQAEAALGSALTKLETLQALAQRSMQPVGICPNAECRKSLNGFDLLASGRCSHCGTVLPDLLTVASASQHQNNVGVPSSVNERDLLLLLGAIGALVGVAYLSSRAS